MRFNRLDATQIHLPQFACARQHCADVPWPSFYLTPAHDVEPPPVPSSLKLHGALRQYVKLPNLKNVARTPETSMLDCPQHRGNGQLVAFNLRHPSFQDPHLAVTTSLKLLNFLIAMSVGARVQFGCNLQRSRPDHLRNECHRMCHYNAVRKSHKLTSHDRSHDAFYPDHQQGTVHAADKEDRERTLEERFERSYEWKGTSCFLSKTRCIDDPYYADIRLAIRDLALPQYGSSWTFEESSLRCA